jgi:putative membrane protein
MSWPHVLTLWSFDPAIAVGVALAAVLYWRGWRPFAVVDDARTRPARRWNAAAFYAGLVTIILALESPIDRLSAWLFSFHMLQHLLLIMVAAPLLILGDPSITMLRGVPLAARRRALGALSHQSWLSTIGRGISWIMLPLPAVIIFLADLYLWHWSPLFNLTLQNDTIHVTEHICFLLTALLFWSQIIDQRAVHARLTYVQRAAYTVLAAAAGNVLAMFLVFTPRPLYNGYAQLASRPYGMTALGDQQIAGAIMWVPVLLLFGAVFSILLFKALTEDERQGEAPFVLGSPYKLLPQPETTTTDWSRR